MASKKKVKYKSKFQDNWLEDEEYKVWLQKDSFFSYPSMLEIIFILETLSNRFFTLVITLSKKISSNFLKICEKLLNFDSSISSKSENFPSLLKSPQF